MLTRQGEVARDPATRAGGNHRNRVPVTRQKTDHQITTRTHQPRESPRWFAQRKKADQLPPDSGASRRQLSPVPGERHQLASPRSTGHHLRLLGSLRSAERHTQSSRNQSAHAGLLKLAHAAARAQGALDDANQILRREARLLWLDEDIEQAKTAAREASQVVKRVQQALAQSIFVGCGGRYRGSSAFDVPAGVGFQQPPPLNDAFFKGSVACMTSASRVDFSALATAVVETASALLALERPASRHKDARSVEAVRAHMDCSSYVGQTRAARALALVKALPMAHNEAPDPVLWPTPEEELAEHTRRKQRRSDTRDRGDRTRGDGGFGGGDKNGGGGSGGGGEGGASVAGDGLGRRRGGNFGRNYRGIGRSSGGGTEREDVKSATAHQSSPARLRPRARTTARWRW